jgi:hypothetical protein
MNASVSDPLKNLPKIVTEARQAYLKLPATMRPLLLPPLLQTIQDELNRVSGQVVQTNGITARWSNGPQWGDSEQDRDNLLALMAELPASRGGSFRQWAARLGWMRGDEPYGKRVERIIDHLNKMEPRLARQTRNRKWTLTAAGEAHASKVGHTNSNSKRKHQSRS